MSDTTEERLVRRFYDDAWNRWDDGAVDELLAPALRFRGSLGDDVHGHDGWRRYRDALRAAVPDFHNEIVELVSAPGRAAARLRYSGHHHGVLLGIRGDGRSFAYDGAAFFSIEDDVITTVWVLGDLDALRRQLTA